MGKQRFKTLKLFFKLVLLFQIYSQHHHKFAVEANLISLNNRSSEKEARHHLLDRPKRPFRLLPLNDSLYVTLTIQNY